MAPHDGFRCKGDDHWVAIAISGDTDWKAFTEAIGNPEWTRSESFADELSRWKNQKDLNSHIEQWTMQHDHIEAMALLQKAGVAAGAGWSTPELVDDPQLNDRGFFIQSGHPVIGNAKLPGIPWRLSDSPPGNYRHSPLLGEHNEYVFNGLLGMTADHIRQLVEEKVIY
jgi:benzylsuccinate CoA-transferase BbsF subunit